MAKLQKSGAVPFAKDPTRVAKFYEVLAGLIPTHVAADIIVLESPLHQLMVHPIPPRIARTIKITQPPEPYPVHSWCCSPFIWSRAWCTSCTTRSS